MTVGTILLDELNNYVGDNKTLPLRPEWDKALLHTLVKGKGVSEAAYEMLPPSIQKVCYIDAVDNYPITIKEISEQSDYLLVNRSAEVKPGGKVFRLDNFKLIGEIELWKKS